MTTQSHDQLPAPVADYFEAANRGETNKLTPFFAADATVRDEGHTYAGIGAISDWVQKTAAAYQPRYRIHSIRFEPGRTVATLEVSGTFPGSPLTLEQAFTVSDGTITCLETL